MGSQDQKLITDGRAWKADGKAQALVGPGLAMPMGSILVIYTSTVLKYTSH